MQKTKKEHKKRVQIRIVSCTILLLAMLLTADETKAQRETEVFIPVGASPGVSGKYAVAGRISYVNTKDSTIVIAGASGNKTVRINSRCKIYIDRSRQKQTCQKGSWPNIKPGLIAEAKYANTKQTGMVEWLKIQP